MKKNYITPKIKLSKTNIVNSICVASIQNPEGAPFVNPEETDQEFEVGTKNRFYDDSNDGWE